MTNGKKIAALTCGLTLLALASPIAWADPIPKGSVASKMKAIGYTDVGGRGGAFKMVVRHVGDKWYMYTGHLWDSGWSILDVTDAASPKFVKFVPGPDNTNTIQMEVHGNTMITALQRRPPNWGGDPKRPNDEGAIIWDVSDPVNWKAVILDISDIAHPKPIGELTLSPPFGGIPVHDVFPIPGRPLLYAHAEATGGGDAPNGPLACSGALPLDGLIDIKDEAHPKLKSIFPTPEPPKGSPYTDFCDKGGRFGPHNTNLEYHLPDVEKQANLIYATFFNAGLRVFDVTDANLPKEVAWFVPPTPVKRYGPLPYDKLVSETEDVLVDTRGNIFITDKHWGIFVLKYLGKGEPRPTAN